MLEDAVRRTPDQPARLNDPGRHEHINDLDKSILTLEAAVQSTPDGHAAKPARLNCLGRSLLTRHEQFRGIDDLKRSISVLEDAVRLTPDGHVDKPVRLNNLGHSILARYRHSGDLADLERSISLREEALKATPDGHPNRSSRLNSLGCSLSIRHEHRGSVADLEEAISLFEDAVRLTPDGHPDKPEWLNNLACSLSTRYKRFGAAVDLEKSIWIRERVLQFTPDGHPDKPARLNNLGCSLSTRYKRFGDVADLGRSISLFEDAVRFTQDGHSDKPKWLTNLGESLSIRYKRFGRVADLDKSVSIREDALRFTPDGHPDKPARLSNLGSSLSTRYKRLGDMADLERSITLREGAVQCTPNGHPEKPLRLNNLGRSLSTRYTHSGDVSDLERSISLFEDAVQCTPDGHPNKPSRLNNLAFSFFQRHQRPGDSSNSDLDRAISYSSRAALSHTGPSLDRFSAAQLWIQCLRLLGQDSQSLLEACTVAVELLPQLAWIGSSLCDRYYQLLQAADGARDAAAAALDVDRPDLAVEWLDQGRSIVWSQLSQLRTPIDDLRAAYPCLAARFEFVSRRLEQAGSASFNDTVDAYTDPSNMLEKEAQQHHALALSRERLLVRIRALPGFGRFLLPKMIKQLSSLARSGSVVFLNASKYRCDALVVVAGSEHVVHVPLSGTNYDELVGMQHQLNELLVLAGRDVVRGARVRGRTADDVFMSVLLHLWTGVVSPILRVLAFPKSGSKLARIFWCPTGPFSFLPVHAAGIYSMTNAGPKLSDVAISSYVPTMSALELPPQKVTRRPIRLLGVPQPSTDGWSHLGGVQGEIDAIRKLASSSPFVDFQMADGSVEDVLSKMKETDWVHFACHATQDRASPLDSGFPLAHGRRLRLFDIARLSRGRGGLAFLSACHTATGDKQLSEEAIHIAAGMLLAGYTGVIATMWSILDRDAPRVTETVYQCLIGDGRIPDGGGAAEALHHAIQGLRDAGVSFLSWVPFIHVGL